MTPPAGALGGQVFSNRSIRSWSVTWGAAVAHWDSASA